MVNPIHNVLSKAKENSNKFAIKGAGAEISFESFHSMVVKVAALLRQQGVKPGDVVGLRMHGGLHAVFVAAVMHEAAVSFAAKVPIVSHHKNDIDFVFSDEPELVSLAAKGVLVTPDLLMQADRLNSDIQPNEFESENSLAHLIFSSGTTGIPKGVCFTVNDLVERAQAASLNWMPVKPFLCQLAQDTVSGAVTYFYSILNGETYLVPGTAKEDAQLIEQMKVASIQTSPAKLKDLLTESTDGNSQLSSLKVIQVAGGLLSRELGEDARKLLGVELVYIYGSTEVGLVAKGPIDPSNAQIVGRVIPSAQVEILGEQGQSLPFESDGVLRVKTNYQSRVYWKVVDSGSSGFIDGWFYPGDMARLSEDGSLRVLGRVDEVVNLSGVKVDPSFIDSQILSYRGIIDFACFAIPDDIQLYEKLAIAVVFDDEISIENFITHMRTLLGDSYPRAVVRVKEIPRNSMGKPNRLQLRAQYLVSTSSN